MARISSRPSGTFYLERKIRFEQYYAVFTASKPEDNAMTVSMENFEDCKVVISVADAKGKFRLLYPDLKKEFGLEDTLRNALDSSCKMLIQMAEPIKSAEKSAFEQLEAFYKKGQASTRSNKLNISYKS